MHNHIYNAFEYDIKSLVDGSQKNRSKTLYLVEHRVGGVNLLNKLVDII